MSAGNGPLPPGAYEDSLDRPVARLVGNRLALAGEGRNGCRTGSRETQDQRQQNVFHRRTSQVFGAHHFAVSMATRARKELIVLDELAVPLPRSASCITLPKTYLR